MEYLKPKSTKAVIIILWVLFSYSVKSLGNSIDTNYKIKFHNN